MRTTPASLPRVFLLAAAMVAPGVAQADNINRYFSYDGVSGAEAWNNTDFNWGTSDGTYSGSQWTNYDNAFFGGTGNLVNVAEGVRVNKMYFTANGYEITGTIGGSVDGFGNPMANNLGADSGITALISANVTSTYDTGIRKHGAGTVNFSGNNTFSRIYADQGVLGIAGGTTNVNTYYTEVRGGGELHLSGGTLNATKGLSISANDFGVNYGATSTLRVSGGTLNVTDGNFFTGRSTNGSGLASRLIQTGGTISYTNSTGWFGLADGGGNTQFDVSGGSLSSVLKMVLGVRGYVTFNISGTAVVTAPAIDFYYSNDITGSGKTSVINLTGGELRTGSIGNNASNNTANLNLDGGLLTATSNATINSNLSAVTAGANGARFDTGVYTVTVDKAIGGAGSLTKQGNGTLVLASSGNSYAGGTTVTAGTLDVSGLLGSGSYAGAVAVNGGTLKFSRSGSTQTLSGALTGSGALQKTGSGTLTVSTGGSYSGAITHDAGILAINGSITGAASTLAVASGATLRGSASYAGSVTAASGAILTAGDGSSGTLSLGALTFSGNGTLNIGTLSNYTSSAAFAVTGNLNLGSGTLTVNLPTAALGAGAYRLLSYGNNITSLAGLVVSGSNKPAWTSGGRTSEGVLRLSPDGNYIEFYVAGDSPFWTGAVNGSWNGTDNNWKTIAGKSATNYQANDTVLFNDGYVGHGVANTAITLGSNVSPASVEFNNSANNYSISGAGSITGASTSLTKGGTGSVTLSTANTYAGATTVNNGTLILGNASALGTSTVTLGGGTLDVGGQSIANAIILNGGAIVGSGTLGGVISEAGGVRSLTVGAGTSLTLSADNTYTGGTTVSSGSTLELGGSVQGNIDNAGTVRFNRSTDATYAGVISGAGAVSVAGSGKVALTGANTYTGATTVESGAALDIGAGTGSVSFGSSAVTNNGTLRLLAGSSGSATIGALSGTGAFTASGQRVYLNADITQSGAVTLTQLGAGGSFQDAIELNKAGTTTVTAGSISLTGDIGKADSDGNTLSLDTSAADGTITLDVSLGRSGVTYRPAGLIANAGTGAINITGTGMADSGWRNTPVSLTGGVITVSSGVYSDSTLTINNSQASTISSALSGGLALTKQGAGTLTVSAAGTNTGALTVSAGTLEITAATVSGFNDSGLGNGGNNITVASGARLHFTGANNRTAGYHTGAVTVNGGTITFDTSDNSFAVGNTLTLDSAPGTLDGSGQWRLRGTGAKLAVASAASGSTVSVAQLTLTTGGENHTIEVANGSGTVDLTISSSISGHFGGESLTKTGAGTLAVTGVVNHNGGTTISNGVLQIGAGGTSGSVAGAITNNASLVFDRSDALTHSGVISGTGSLTKNGSGDLTLGAANSYAGGTTVNAGKLILGDLAALGTGTVTVLGGVLDLATLNPTNTIVLSGGSLLNFENWAPASLTVSGNVSAATLNGLNVSAVTLGTGATIDVSTLTKNVVVSGAPVLTGLSSYAGTLQVGSGGTLDLSDSGNRPGASATISLGSGATLAVGATAFNGAVTYAGGTITGNFNGTVNVSGTGVSLGAGSIGSGTVAVGTGASVSIGSGFANNIRLDGGAIDGNTLNNLSGTLTVAAGQTLDLDGAAGTVTTDTNAGITLESGAKLKGNGEVGSVTLQAGGILAPGNSPGTITASSLTLQAGGTMDFEVGSLAGLFGGPPTAGVDYDTVVVSGVLNLAGLSSSSRLNLNVISLVGNATGAPGGAALGWDPLVGFELALFKYGTLQLGDNADVAWLFNIQTLNFVDADNVSVSSAQFHVYDNVANNELRLVYTAPVPEPSTYGLVLGGLALAVAAARRRRRQA